jgi:hypothetical protein
LLWLGAPSYRFQAFKDRNGIKWDTADTAVMLATYILASAGTIGAASQYASYFLQGFLLLKMITIIICWLYNKYIDVTGL